MHEVIEKFYRRIEEGAQRLYSRITASAGYNTSGIRVEDIDDWIKRSHLTVKSKFYDKNKFNSFVSLGPQHAFQVDLCNFNYEQAVNFHANRPPPRGLISVGVFTTQAQIVPLMYMEATSWKDAQAH